MWRAMTAGRRARVDRLGDVAVAAGGARLLLVALHRVGGQGDDHDVARRGVGLQPPGQLEAVHAGQLDVHQDQARAGTSLEHREGLLGVAGRAHLVALGRSSRRSSFRFAGLSSTIRIGSASHELRCTAASAAAAPARPRRGPQLLDQPRRAAFQTTACAARPGACRSAGVRSLTVQTITGSRARPAIARKRSRNSKPSIPGMAGRAPPRPASRARPAARPSSRRRHRSSGSRGRGASSPSSRRACGSSSTTSTGRPVVGRTPGALERGQQLLGAHGLREDSRGWRKPATTPFSATTVTTTDGRARFGPLPRMAFSTSQPPMSGSSRSSVMASKACWRAARDASAPVVAVRRRSRRAAASRRARRARGCRLR